MCFHLKRKCSLIKFILSWSFTRLCVSAHARVNITQNLDTKLMPTTLTLAFHFFLQWNWSLLVRMAHLELYQSRMRNAIFSWDLSVYSLEWNLVESHCASRDKRFKMEVLYHLKLKMSHHFTIKIARCSRMLFYAVCFFSRKFRLWYCFFFLLLIKSPHAGR